jgi:hypothetical protein
MVASVRAGRVAEGDGALVWRAGLLDGDGRVDEGGLGC